MKLKNIEIFQLGISDDVKLKNIEIFQLEISDDEVETSKVGKMISAPDNAKSTTYADELDNLVNK